MSNNYKMFNERSNFVAKFDQSQKLEAIKGWKIKPVKSPTTLWSVH